MTTRRSLTIGGVRIRRGETRDIQLPVSEMYTGEPVYLPLRVIRAAKPGPTLLLTAAIHGDEINGTGIIRELMFDQPPALVAGTLISLPVINVFGFETHDRYMPDRRDLNRCFPGSPTGSLASRFAHQIMHDIVARCDFGLDLHSAAAGRTNFPNVRADLRQPRVRELAEAVGCELIVNGRGPEGAFRRAACEAGCPTVVLEAGEIGKIEPAVVEVGLRGVHNVLAHLGMIDAELHRPPYQTRVNRTMWIRAELGGLLRFHVAPGDLVIGGQPLASNESVFGQARSIIIAPKDGIILGMITHPAVKPGEPVCHLARPERRLSALRRALRDASADSPDARVRDELAAGISVMPAPVAPGGDSTPAARPPKPSRRPRSARSGQGKTPRRS